ncbi:MAG: hypothetical protein WCK11_00590 [Candidatus Falkowbacteria bacterium]
MDEFKKNEVEAESFPEVDIDSLSKDEFLAHLLGNVKKQFSKISEDDTDEQFFPSKFENEVFGEKIKGVLNMSHKTPQEKRVRKKEFLDLRNEIGAYQNSITRIGGRLISKVKQNPDIKSEEFDQELTQHLDSFGIYGSMETTMRFMKGFNSYEDYRQIAKQMIAEHPSNENLYSFFTHTTPKSSVRFELGAAHLVAYCENVDDYQTLRHVSTPGNFKDQEKGVNRSTGTMKKIYVNGLDGFEVPLLLEIILTHVNQIPRSSRTLKEITDHEDAHILQELIGLPSPGSDFNKTRQAIEGSADESIIESRLELGLRKFRKNFEYYASDEIVAFMTEPRLSPEKILNKIIKPGSEGGIYDFTGKYKDDWRNVWQEIFPEDVDLPEEATTPLQQLVVEKTQKILGEEYTEVLKKSIAAAFDLQEVLGPKNTQILLMSEPLDRWPRALLLAIAEQDKKITREGIKKFIQREKTGKVLSLLLGQSEEKKSTKTEKN